MENDAFSTIPLSLYWRKSMDFGDVLSPYLLSNFSGKPISEIKSVYRDDDDPKFIVTGSLLGDENIKNAYIFGAGFTHENEYFTGSDVRVMCVRGPGSLRMLNNFKNEFGNHNIIIDNTVVIGEPSLCLPKFFKPSVDVTFPLGILPDPADYNEAKRLFGHLSNVKIIDLRIMEGENTESFIERIITEINQCDKTICSSLHGMIVSVAYGVPTDWCTFTKNKSKHEDFIFLDFIESINTVVRGNSYIEPQNLYTILPKYNIVHIMQAHRGITNRKVDVQAIIDKAKAG